MISLKRCFATTILLFMPWLWMMNWSCFTKNGPWQTLREAVARAYTLPLGRLHTAHLRETPLQASGKIDHRALTALAARAVA